MKRKSGAKRGRPATGHVKVQFNLRPEINELIKRAATHHGVTRSQMLETLVYMSIEAWAPKTPQKRHSD